MQQTRQIGLGAVQLLPQTYQICVPLRDFELHSQYINLTDFSLNAVQPIDRLFNQLYHREIVHAQLNMLGSHDTPRIANVAAFDRTAVSLIFLCQMTVPGAPNIYYGDEIGMRGRHDPDCRRAFPWENEANWDQEMRRDVRRFIKLRQQIPALRRGDFKVIHANGNVVAYQRQCGESQAIIAFNVGQGRGSFNCPKEMPSQLRLQQGEAAATLSAGQTVDLDGRTGAVWSNQLER